METTYIKTVLKVAETGNMAKAADELFVEQAAVSQHVIKIEKQLGFQLFERTGNRIKPLIVTDQGAKWLAFARKALMLLEMGTVEIKRAERVKHRKGRLPI